MSSNSTDQTATLRFLWNTVKYHLSGNGLLDVAERYPEFREEAEELQKTHRPLQIQMATKFGNLSVGSQVAYTGVKWREFVCGKNVTVVETPFRIAVSGEVSVQTVTGQILTVPTADLS
jgi:hypothetical protein